MIEFLNVFFPAQININTKLFFLLNLSFFILMEILNLFSSLQVNIKTTAGSPQWGLVEYSSPLEAEASMRALQGVSIKGQQPCIKYCTPGKRAITLYSKLQQDKVGFFVGFLIKKMFYQNCCWVHN